MGKGFLIYEEMRKYFPIFEEAVSHIWLCNCSTLNFLIYEANLILFFISSAVRSVFVQNSLAVLGIRDILVRIRFRISGSEPLTNGSGDPTPDPTPFFNDFKDAKSNFFLITYPHAHYIKVLFCKLYFSPLNTFMRKGKDPDPDLWLINPDPDPGGPNTCGSGSGSGSPTLQFSNQQRYVKCTKFASGTYK